MIQVELINNKFDVTFSVKNDFGQKRQYDAICITDTSQSRVYCSAIANGVPYTTVAKKMQFDDEGNVFLKFGKSKINIGTYKEVV